MSKKKREMETAEMKNNTVEANNLHVKNWIKEKRKDRTAFLRAYRKSKGRIADTAKELGVSKQAVYQKISGIAKSLPCFIPGNPDKCKKIVAEIEKMDTDDKETKKALHPSLVYLLKYAAKLASRASSLEKGASRALLRTINQKEAREEYLKLFEDIPGNEKLLKSGEKALAEEILRRLEEKKGGELPSGNIRKRMLETIQKSLSGNIQKVEPRKMVSEYEVKKALKQKKEPCPFCEEIFGTPAESVEKEILRYAMLLSSKIKNGEGGWLLKRKRPKKTMGLPETIHIVPCGKKGMYIVDENDITEKMEKRIRESAIAWIQKNRKIVDESGKEAYVNSVPRSEKAIREILENVGCRVSEIEGTDIKFFYFLIVLASDEGRDPKNRTVPQKMVTFTDKRLPEYVDKQMCEYAKKQYEEKKREGGGEHRSKCNIQFLINAFTKKHKMNPGEVFIIKMLKNGCGIPLTDQDVG